MCLLLVLCILCGVGFVPVFAGTSDGVRIFVGAKIATERAWDMLKDSTELTDAEKASILVSWSSSCVNGRWAECDAINAKAAKIQNAFLLRMPYTKVSSPDSVHKSLEIRGMVQDLVRSGSENIHKYKDHFIHDVAELSYLSYREMYQFFDDNVSSLEAVLAASGDVSLEENEKSLFAFFGQDQAATTTDLETFFLPCLSDGDRAQQISCMFASLFSDEVFVPAGVVWRNLLLQHVLMPAVLAASSDDISEYGFDDVIHKAAQTAALQIKSADEVLLEGEQPVLSVEDAKSILEESLFVKSLRCLLPIISGRSVGLKEWVDTWQEQRGDLGAAVRQFLWEHQWRLCCKNFSQNPENSAVADSIITLIAQRFAGKGQCALRTDAQTLCDLGHTFQSAKYWLNFAKFTTENLREKRRNHPINFDTYDEERRLSLSVKGNEEALRYMYLESAIQDVASALKSLSCSKILNGGKDVEDNIKALSKHYVAYAYYTYEAAVLGPLQKSEAFRQEVFALTTSAVDDPIDQLKQKLWNLAVAWGNYSGDPNSVKGKVSVEHIKKSNRNLLLVWLQDPDRYTKTQKELDQMPRAVFMQSSVLKTSVLK